MLFQVHFWVHGGIGDKTVDRPLVVGHEASGTIHAVGSAITHLQPGDNVAIEPGQPCRRCQRCKEGLYNLCPEMKFAACPPDTYGTLTKYFKIPGDFCYKLPEGTSLEEGVLAEPLAVAVHGVKLANIRPGQAVVIFGAGTIGLVCGAVARLYGALKIIAVDINDSRLEFAARFNRCSTFKPDLKASARENAQRLVEEHNLGLGADAVIEASGAQSSIQTAIHVLRLGGSYVQTGLGAAMVDFPMVLMSEKELHLHGSFRYGPGDFDTAIGILAQGSVHVRDLISDTFPFEDATAAWEATRRGQGIKNLIRGVAD